MAIKPPKSLSGAKFDDPFLLPSSEAFPDDVKSSFDLCLYLYRINPMYGAVTARVVSYFLTALEVVGKNGSDVERAKLKELLTDRVGLFVKLARAGVEWAIYGNSFLRVNKPFDRYLIDTRSGFKAVALSMYPEEHVVYNWRELTYTVPDLDAAKSMPRSRRKDLSNLPKVTLPFEDQPAMAPDRFDVTFLDPRYVTLDTPHFSDSTQYVYTIPPLVESRIRSNHHHEIVNTPKGILKAVSESADYRYYAGEIFHFKQPTPSGVSDSGWGCPAILWHFDTLYQMQVYRKADQAIAMDFMLPFRIFTPDMAGSGPNGPHQNLIGYEFAAQIKAMVANRRKDKFAMHALPFKLDYHEFGGEGKAMTLHETLEYHAAAMCDGLGYPRELFQGTLTIDQLPTALRLFERTYEWLYQAILGATRFIAAKVQDGMDLDKMEVSIARPAIAHNVENRALLMQLATNREIPRDYVYRELGIEDSVEAQRKQILEEQNIQRMREEMAATYEKERTQGSMAETAMMAAEQQVMATQGGGAPGAPAGGAGAVPGSAGAALDYSIDPSLDPAGIQARAQEIAAQWIQMHAAQPNSHRREMDKCDAINPTLYAAAKDAMGKMRNQAGSAGKAQVADFIGAGPPA